MPTALYFEGQKQNRERNGVMDKKGTNRKKGNAEQKGSTQLSVKRKRIFLESQNVAQFKKTNTLSSFVFKRARDSPKESDFGGGGGDTRSDTDSDLFTGSEESTEEKCPMLVKSFVSTISEFDSDVRDPEALNLGILEKTPTSEDILSPRNNEQKIKFQGSKENRFGSVLQGAERVLRYLSKRVVQVNPIMKKPNYENMGMSNKSKTNRFTGHFSKVSRKTSVSQCTIVGKVVEVTTTNESAVVDSWLLENLGHICREEGREDSAEGGNASFKKGSSSLEHNLKANTSRDIRETAISVKEREGNQERDETEETEDREESEGRDKTEETEETEEREGREGLSCENGGEVLLGLDLEWRPNRFKKSDNKVALLQISNENRCLLVQMLFLDSTPRLLETVLCSPKVLLGGVGVQEDAYKLARDHGINCLNRVVDLNILAGKRLRTAGVRQMGLKQLTKLVLGESIVKSKKITMSDWAQESLVSSQVQYAAMDAWVSCAILCELLNKDRIRC